MNHISSKMYSQWATKLTHRRVAPNIKFASTHLYTWVVRGTARVKCLAQEHNTMSPDRPRTRTTRSGVEHSNHEATCRKFWINVLSILIWVSSTLWLNNTLLSTKRNGFDPSSGTGHTCKLGAARSKINLERWL